MSKFLGAIIALIIWYFIGVFISNEFNPLNWWIIGKIFIVIVLFCVLINIFE